MKNMSNELILLPINLQLFAEDIEDDDEVENEDEDIDTTEAESDFEESTESDTTEESTEADVDSEKTTLAKIKAIDTWKKQKQENKALRKRLEVLEAQEQEKEMKHKRQALASKYIERGWDEEYANEQADKAIEAEAVKEKVKKLEFLTENAEILSKYPDAKRDVAKLLKLQKSTGWSLEKICRVEYADNAFDSKVKADQESQLKKSKRNITPTPTGGQTPIQSVKLTAEDERAYQFYAKKNPGVNRKQYAEKLSNANSQKIPHDRWE
jgi:hypothetical protein